MDLLKINTAGSVDDGKSTLIGRLLYDSNSLTVEQLDLIQKKTKEKGLEDLDLSVLTDGLIAEREQGITIDVAHIYFSTNKRKFIIADSPGHKEYTRNMVTGASTSQVSIILIDARKGLLEQTYRHFFINSLLGQPYIIFCVNKMDLVDYSQKVFDKISQDIDLLVSNYTSQSQTIFKIPISSLKGDNIVEKSKNLQFYDGDPLLDLLHKLDCNANKKNQSFRMDVQQVLHIQNNEFTDFRAYAGRILSGEIHLNDEILVYPTKQKCKVSEIRKFKSLYKEAFAGNSIMFSITENLDISRGMIFVDAPQQYMESKTYDAQIVWLSENTAKLNQKFIIQAGSRNSICKLSTIESLISPVQPAEKIKSEEINLNEIANIQLTLAQPIFLDYYSENRENGSFILIDSKTNDTVAVGFRIDCKK